MEKLKVQVSQCVEPNSATLGLRQRKLCKYIGHKRQKTKKLFKSCQRRPMLRPTRLFRREGLVAIGNFECFHIFKLGDARLFVTMQDKVAFAGILSIELA